LAKSYFSLRLALFVLTAAVRRNLDAIQELHLQGRGRWPGKKFEF
jgi:hypothetical protein